MSMLKIEVHPDTSFPAGGHAIIRLKGVGPFPPGVTFRIDPIDETLTEGEAEGWPTGNLRPLDTRQTAEGVEWRIGPEIVDAYLLEPGTPVTIRVPESELSAELVWPHLPMSMKTSASPVVMSPSQMAAEMAEHERIKTQASDRAQAQLVSTRAAERAALSLVTQIHAESREMPPSADRGDVDRVKEADTLGAHDGSADDHTPPAHDSVAAAARKLEAALALEPIDHDAVGVGSASATPLPDFGSASTAGLRMGASASLSSLSAKAQPERIETFPPLPMRDMSLPAIMLKHATPPPVVNDAHNRSRSTIEGRIHHHISRGHLMPFLTGIGVAGIALAGLFAVLAVKPTPLQPGLVAATATGPAGGPDIGSTATHKVTLSDAFSVGIQSPRGEIATNIDLPTALRLADYNLHGVDRPIDRAEAEFWLKKSLSLTASHSQLRWAMTQLGVLAAEPVTGVPDFDKARLLWEISSANGDPIAMCFLGTLAEFGLGVAADKNAALSYYKRAKTAGGCPKSDEAIMRLSQ